MLSVVILWSKKIFKQLQKYSTIVSLKGPKHEIFESGFFTQIRGLWLGDLGTGKKIEISKAEVIILRLSPRISY